MQEEFVADREWVMYIALAKWLGVTKEQVLQFLRDSTGPDTGRALERRPQDAL
ncbi:MAG: anti-repressor SinI family protein [Alicyclobacillus sp.]|nr:anti-repressor SinI family protein [Alicyclobacillus sp.]